MANIGSVRRRLGLGITATLAAGAAIMAAAPVASAEAVGCSDNVCIYLAGNAGGSITVQGWARSADINGTLAVSGPGGWDYGSPDQRWIGQKQNYMSWSRNSSPAGQYCVTGNDDSSGYEGTACASLS